MKKYIAFLIALCLLFGAACTQTGTQGETEPVSSIVAPSVTPAITFGENTEQAEALGAVAGETMAVQYTEDFYPFSGGYTVKDAARVGDNLLFLGVKEDSYMMGLSSYAVNDAARVTISETCLIALDEPEAEDEAITYNITAGADGYFYVLTGNETENRYPEIISVLRYSPTGEFQEKMTISDWPEKTVLRDAKVMGDGKVVLQSDNLIAVYQWQGSLLTSQAVNDGYILSSSNTAEGVIFNTGNYYLLDGATMELTRLNPSWPDGNIYALSFTDCQNLNGEYIINDGGSFIQYDFDTDVADVLMRWNYSVNSTGNFGPACRVSEFSFVCVFMDREAVQITGMELVPFVERSVVNVALIGVSDYSISEINNKSQLYEYHAVSYGEDEINRFLTEMIAGNVPDLVLFKDNINTDAGSFEDLYSYIDADPDISRESFIPNFLDALDVGGELHQLWDQVCISTLEARQSDVGAGRGLTPADYNRIAADSDQYAAVFQNYMSKQNLLEWVSRVGISVCIDKEHGTCNFDDPAFRNLIAWCRDMGDGLQEGSDVTAYDISEVVLSFDQIKSMGRLNYLPQLFGEPITFVGFPDGADGYSYYSMSGDAYGIAMAIPTASGNKDGAWTYIKYQLSTERQLNLGEYSNLPVNTAALKRKAESALSDEAYDLLYQLLDRTKYAEMFADQNVLDIIVSGGQSYINGSATLDSAIAMIQSRASIYMGEQYG